VETTGLADPAPVVNALIPGSIPAASLTDQTVARHFRLARVVTCFDALTGEFALDHAFEAVKQIAFADTVVLTKTDLAERQGLSRNLSSARARLSATNPFAEIIHRSDLRFADLFHGAYLEADRVDEFPVGLRSIAFCGPRAAKGRQEAQAPMLMTFERSRLSARGRSRAKGCLCS